MAISVVDIALGMLVIRNVDERELLRKTLHHILIVMKLD